MFHARALTDPDLGSWSRQKIFRQRPLGTKVVLDVCILLFLRDVLFRLIFKNIVLVASLLKVIDKTLPEKWMDWRASNATCWRVCCKATVKAGRWKTLTVSPVSGSLRGLSRLTAPDVFLELKHFPIKDFLIGGRQTCSAIVLAGSLSLGFAIFAFVTVAYVCNITQYITNSIIPLCSTRYQRSLSKLSKTKDLQNTFPPLLSSLAASGRIEAHLAGNKRKTAQFLVCHGDRYQPWFLWKPHCFFN